MISPHSYPNASAGSKTITGKENPARPVSLWVSKRKYIYTTTPREVPAYDDPVREAANYCTDHMITVIWSADSGWSIPEPVPYSNISLSPTASVLHYSTECFEGMKAFRGYDGKLRIFRSECNTRRMLMSAERISLPAFEPQDLEALILKLLEVDGPKFLPMTDSGKFIYIRPTLIGTHAGLGVSVPKEAMLFIIATYMTDLSDLKHGLRLFASRGNQARAWPGGHGFAKVGANSGPTLNTLTEAKQQGFDQVLWLFGPQGYITKCGGSNFFIIWRTRNGILRLQTPPLDDNLILAGVVRQSILTLAKDRLPSQTNPSLNAEVIEENFTMDEVVEAVKEGRVLEAFTCGTAYFVSPISSINHNGREYSIPLGCGNTGLLTEHIKSWLGDIYFGREQHPWGHVVNERL